MIRSTPALAMLGLAAWTMASCGPASVVVGAGAVAARTVLQERSTKDAFNDADIQLRLNKRYLEHSTGLFADVSSSVVEGRVVLTGSVPSRADKVTATEIAWQTKGVSSVGDELTVGEDTGAVAYAEDAWISNQLRVALLTDGAVSSVNYSVQTVDKVVHLTGLARSGAELSRVLDHAAGIRGVEKVVSHVLTIDDPRRVTAFTGAQQTTG